MLVLINFCFFVDVLLPSLISCSTEMDFRDLKFAYRKDVPYYDRNDILFSTTSQSFLASYGRCAVQCIEDLSCNALELCRAPGGSECRATTGLLKTEFQTSGTETCKQYVMVRYCLCKSRNFKLTLNNGNVFTKSVVTNFVKMYLSRTFHVVTMPFQTGDRVCVYLVRYYLRLVVEIKINTTVILISQAFLMFQFFSVLSIV